MNSKSRMQAVLQGRMPDQVPVGFFYNCDYKSACAGLTPQDYIFGTNDDRYRAMAATYERHREDWIHADPGISRHWQETHRLGWTADQAYVEDTATGERDAVGLDLTLASSDGKSHGPGLDFGYSYVRLNRPVETVRHPEDLRQARVRTAQELIEEGFLEPPQRLVEAFGAETFITLPMGNLFFNSIFIFGMEEGLVATLTEPEMLEALLDLNTQQELEVVKAAARVGLDGVWLAEMLVSADVVSPRVYTQWVAPRHRRLVDEAHAHGLVALAYLTGNCLPLLPTARGVGYDGVVTESLDKHGHRIDVAEVRRGLGPKLGVFGNLDPVDHLIQGDLESLHAEMERELMAAGRDGAFVMHSNIISTPVLPDRVDEVIRYARQIGRYPLSSGRGK